MITNYAILPGEEQKSYRERLSSCASTIWSHKVELAGAVSSILLITSIVLMIKEGCVHRDHYITNEDDDEADRKLRGLVNVESKHARERILRPIPTDTNDDTTDASVCFHSDPANYLFTIGAPSFLITLAFFILKNESNRDRLTSLSVATADKIKQWVGGSEAGL